MRLFIALELPGPVRRAMAGDTEPLRPLCPRARFVPEENYHLTLVFLGETDPGRLPAVIEAMDHCPSPAIPLTAGGLGRFGDTLWRELRGGGDLYSLQRRLSRELRERDFALEKRAYVPHLTLARRFRLPDDPAPPPMPERSFMAGTMALLRSDPGQHGMIYTPMYRMHLDQKKN